MSFIRLARALWSLNKSESPSPSSSPTPTPSSSEISAIVEQAEADQPFERTWALTSNSESPDQQVEKLSLETRGLTIVRVRPDLALESPPVRAQVRVLSKSPEHLEDIDVRFSPDGFECSIANTSRTSSQQSIQLTEVTVPSTNHIATVVATGKGSEVLLDDGVLRTSSPTSSSTALTNPDEAQRPSFYLGAINGANIFVSSRTTPITSPGFKFVTIGSSLIVVAAPNIMTVMAVGSQAYGQLRVCRDGDRVIVRDGTFGLLGPNGVSRVFDRLDVSSFVNGRQLRDVADPLGAMDNNFHVASSRRDQVRDESLDYDLPGPTEALVEIRTGTRITQSDGECDACVIRYRE